MHVPSAVGRNIIADHVEVMTHSPIESLIRSLEVNDRKIHPVLGHDLGITNALRLDRILPVLQEESEWISRCSLHLAHRVSPALRQHRLAGLRGVAQSTDEWNIEWRKPEW